MIIDNHEDVAVYEKDGQHYVSVHNVEYAIDKLLSVDEVNMSDELSKQAAKLGFWSILTGELEVLHNLEKTNTELLFSGLFRNFKDTGMKVTDKLADSLVRSSAEYSDQKIYELDAFRIYTAVKSIMFGLRTKTDMLINLSANIRQEMSMTGSTVRVMKEALKSA